MSTRKISGGECSKNQKIRKLDPATREETKSLNPVLGSLLDALRHGKFSDVTFIVGKTKERIPCHQLLLEIRSSVFRGMFNEPRNQDKHIPLRDDDPDIFRKFLKYIYTDALEADVSEALELLQLAHKYDVQLLESRCADLLGYKLKLEDSIAVFQTARKCENVQLMDKIGDMWVESLSKIQSLPIFNQLDKETLIYILKRDDLKMKEVDIFRLAFKWAEKQTDATLQESLQGILPHIRFPTMSLNEFTTTVVDTEVLPLSAVVKICKYFGNDDEAKKLMANELGFSTQERQPKDPTLYVALYSKGPTDGANSWSSRKLEYLKETFEFYKKNQFHNDSLEPIQAIGLSAISLYSPLRAASTFQSAGATAYFRAFKICLKSRLYPQSGLDPSSYTELQSLSSVLVEEGKITDVKLNTAVLLEEGRAYCITIEEEPGDVSVPGYHRQMVADCTISNVAATVGNVGPTLLSCCRDVLQGFKIGNISGHPGLIHRLGFQKL